MHWGAFRPPPRFGFLLFLYCIVTYVKKMTIIRYSLIATFFFAGVLLLLGCDEQLVGDDSERNLPDIPDGEGQSFVELTGSDATTVSRGGPTSFTVAPNATIGDDVEVYFSVSSEGDAQQGRDFVVQSAEPVTIPFDSIDGSVQSSAITIAFPHTDALNRPVNISLELDSARTVEGESVPVGRGAALEDPNPDIEKGRVKDIAIDWSKAELFVQNSAGFDFGDTAVNDTTASAFGPFNPDGGVSQLLADNDLIVLNTASFRSTTLSNVSITGSDSTAFNLKQIYRPFVDASATPPLPLNPLTGSPPLGYTFVVEFIPQSAGDKTAELTFTASNVPAPSQQQAIPLVGEGTSGGS